MGVARSFRLVCEDSDIPLVEALLEAEGFRFTPEPFNPRCRRLAHEPTALGASLAAYFGLIYIQDRSSMLPPLALAPKEGSAVLDMCASPGGKTSFLAQLTGPSGFVLGNEPSADRLATLRRNLARMNLPQAATCGMKGQELPLPECSLGHILLDPPCSGWGTAEKNPQVFTLWTPGKIGPLLALQRALLAKAASLLTPGGRLLYSTCTTNRAENEEQAVWAANELGLEFVELPPFEGFRFHDPELPEASGTLRVDGEGSGAQGFYLALLAKPGEQPEAGLENAADGRGGVCLPDGVCGDDGLAWENLPPGFFEMFKDELCFLPEAGRKFLPPRRKGQRLGQVKGDVFRPWARARLLAPRPGTGPELVVEEPATLHALLAGRSLAVSDGSDGPVSSAGAARRALYFRGLALGFVSVKGGRILWSDR